jgi:hypothetical protein
VTGVNDDTLPEEADVETRNLLFDCVPERRSELEVLVAQIDFRRARDQPAFILEALAFGDRGVVRFTDRTMHQAWLISYLAWKALHEQLGFVVGFLMQGRPYDLTSPDVGAAGIAAAITIDRMSDALRALRAADSGAGSWPADVPQLTETNEHLNEQDHAAFELVCFGMAFAMLHECHHVFERIACHPYTGPTEEMAADAYAAHFILDGVAETAAANSWDVTTLTEKRAIGVFLGLVLVLESSEAGLREPTETHPAWTARIRQLLQVIEQLNLPQDGNFWIYATSFLLSRARRERIEIRQLAYRNVRGLFFSALDIYEAA